MKPPILIAGPTASGKSALAMSLAVHQDSCIINADALQIYDGWRILTARPDASDENMVVHQLFGTVPMNTAYSVGDWLRDLAVVLAQCREKELQPIIVGGTGLYLSALTEGLSEIPPVPAHVRAQADAIRTTEGAAGFVRELEKTDPATLRQIDRNNPMRAQRAWEVLAATGRGLADWQSDAKQPLIPLSRSQAIVLRAEPAWLNQRIEQRLQEMLAAGVLDECTAVLQAGWDPDLPSSRALGAAEFIEHLQGRIPLELAVERTVIRTRQYAKRQRTWFRGRMGGWNWIDASSGLKDPITRLI